MKDRSDGPRNDRDPLDTRTDPARGAESDEQNGTPIGATHGVKPDLPDGTPIDTDASRAQQDADVSRISTDAPRPPHQERPPMNTRRQRTGHATDETADAWMYRPGDGGSPRSGYGEQGFGAGEGEDGRWGGGRRGGYGGGRPGGDHGTRGGGWAAGRQRYEMGRGPRSFGPDGWGPEDPATERKDVAERMQEDEPAE